MLLINFLNDSLLLLALKLVDSFLVILDTIALFAVGCFLLQTRLRSLLGDGFWHLPGVVNPVHFGQMLMPLHERRSIALRRFFPRRELSQLFRGLGLPNP